MYFYFCIIEEQKCYKENVSTKKFLTWLTTNTFLQGWGFCHKVCDQSYDIFTHQLRKVQLTILSDELCKEIGNVAADNLGNEQVVNERKELCGAFVNEMNVTFVNYTMQIKKKNAERFQAFF